MDEAPLNFMCSHFFFGKACNVHMLIKEIPCKRSILYCYFFHIHFQTINIKFHLSMSIDGIFNVEQHFPAMLNKSFECFSWRIIIVHIWMRLEFVESGIKSVIKMKYHFNVLVSIHLKMVWNFFLCACNYNENELKSLKNILFWSTI